METVLRDTDGIVDVSVNFADGMIAIEYEPEELDEQEVLARVRKLGFKTRIVQPQ